MCFRNALLGKRVLVIAFLLSVACVMYIMVVLVWICCFSFPLGVWEGLEFVIVALPGLFSYLFITKTCLYNFDPLKPHFYVVKLGFTGVNIIFLISVQNIDCGYS